MPLTLRRWLIASYVSSTFAFAFAPTALADAAVSTPRASERSVKPGLESSPSALRVSIAEAERSRPKRREARILGLQLPAFLAFGLGSLSAGGAAFTGFAARRGNDPISCDSRCTEQAATQRRLLIATGVLTGVAAAGVGVGFTLMLKAPKDLRRDAIRPRLDLGLSGKKAVAKIGWVF
jgi:hypothetical protein